MHDRVRIEESDSHYQLYRIKTRGANQLLLANTLGKNRQGGFQYILDNIMKKTLGLWYRG